LICTGLLAFSSVAFGFAKSFEVALIIRLITGLLGGEQVTTAQ
jgi:predicted MFS family arabinose efflux permease